jgi:signal transduction histidine kinase
VYGQAARWLIHDLRNPTQALSLITDLMNEEPEAGDPGVADTIREATAHLTRSLELLDRLLRLAPAAAESVPLSLLDALQFVAALYRTHRTAVALAIDTSSAGPLPAVRGVEHELEQVLLTLLLLTLDESSGREMTRISVRAIPDPIGVRLTMTSDGPPLGPEQAARLAEEPALDSARALAERHGGRLAYQSGSDGNAGFVLLLPRWA